jgi:hypothetical protein
MAVSQEDTRVIKCTAQSDAVTRTVLPGFVIWTGATTAGHKLEVQDGSGDVVLAWSVAAASESIVLPVGTEWRGGFTVTDLDSGTVYVHLM